MTVVRLELTAVGGDFCEPFVYAKAAQKSASKAAAYERAAEFGGKVNGLLRPPGLRAQGSTLVV
jgi:hypothetical protein